MCARRASRLPPPGGGGGDLLYNGLYGYANLSFPQTEQGSIHKASACLAKRLDSYSEHLAPSRINLGSEPKNSGPEPNHLGSE